MMTSQNPNQELPMKTDRPGMSVQETSVLASLVSTVVIYAIFFSCTASGAVQGPTRLASSSAS